MHLKPDQPYRSGRTVTYRQDPVKKNDFLQSLDGEAESWSAGYGS